VDTAIARTPVVAPAPPSSAPDPIASCVAQAYAPSESLPEPLRKRLRAALKDRSRSPIALHHVIDLPRPDGSHEVFALYEYAVYEDCVARYPDRETGREHCAGHFERVFDHVDTINDKELVRYRKAPINRNCLALGAVHAVLGPPGTRPADALVEFTATDLPDLRCHPVAYQRVVAADVDGDHQLELYIDVTTMDDWVGSFRDSFGTVSALRSDWDRRLFILAGTDVRNAKLAVRVDQVRARRSAPRRDGAVCRLPPVRVPGPRRPQRASLSPRSPAAGHRRRVARESLRRPRLSGLPHAARRGAGQRAREPRVRRARRSGRARARRRCHRAPSAAAARSMSRSH